MEMGRAHRKNRIYQMARMNHRIEISIEEKKSKLVTLKKEDGRVVCFKHRERYG